MLSVNLFFALTLQVYGDLHGHTEHFHKAGDDSGWWRQQKEVKIRMTSVPVFFVPQNKVVFIPVSIPWVYLLGTTLLWLVDRQMFE